MTFINICIVLQIRNEKAIVFQIPTILSGKTTPLSTYDIKIIKKVAYVW